MRGTFAWASLAVFFLFHVSARAETSSVIYEVHLTKLDYLQATIALPSKPERLYMSIGGTGSDDGFVRYVRELKMKCGEKSIALDVKGAEWIPDTSMASGPCT